MNAHRAGENTIGQNKQCWIPGLSLHCELNDIPSFICWNSWVKKTTTRYSKNVWKNRKISLQTKIRILEATVVKYGFEAWALLSKEIAYGLSWVPG